MFHRLLIVGLITASTSLLAADVPGGQVLTAEPLNPDTYQVLLSPAFRIDPGGTYLSSRLRYQMNDDFSVGARFGAGEAGFHLGAEGVVQILSPQHYEPSVAILGGIYLNRLTPTNYFVFRAMPTVSRQFMTSFGTVTPYTGVQLAPAFELSGSNHQFTVKTAFGAQFGISAWEGMTLWTEFNVGILNSAHELVLGISYPFAAL